MSENVVAGETVEIVDDEVKKTGTARPSSSRKKGQTRRHERQQSRPEKIVLTPEQREELENSEPVIAADGQMRKMTPEEYIDRERYIDQRTAQGMPKVIDYLMGQDAALVADPEKYAEWQALRRRSGISMRFYNDADILHEAERRARLNILPERLVGLDANTQRWLMINDNLRLAADDAEALDDYSRILLRMAYAAGPEGWGTTLMAFRGGMSDTLRGDAEVNRMNAELAEQRPDGRGPTMRGSYVNPVTGRRNRSGPSNRPLAGGKLAEYADNSYAREMRRSINNQFADWQEALADYVDPGEYLLPTTTKGRLFHDIARSTPYTMIGIGRSFLINAKLGPVAGPLAAALWGRQSESQRQAAGVYHELRRRGEDVESASKKAREVKAANFGLLFLSDYMQEVLTFGGFGVTGKMIHGALPRSVRGSMRYRRFITASRRAQRYISQTEYLKYAAWTGERLLSAAFEGAEEIGQELIDAWALGDGVTEEQLYWSGLVGMASGGLFSFGGSGVNYAYNRLQTGAKRNRIFRQAEDTKKVLDELLRAAGATKTSRRLPELLTDFADSVTEGRLGDLYISAAEFEQVFDSGAERAAARMGLAEQYSQAAAEHGDIAIPAAELMTLMATDEQYAKLKDHLRLEAGDMSAAEAERYGQRLTGEARELKDEVAELLKGTTLAAQETAVLEERIKEQLTATGRMDLWGADGKDAGLAARLITARALVLAEREGISPLEWGRRLNIVARDVEDKSGKITESYNHPLNPGVNPDSLIAVQNLPEIDDVPNRQVLVDRLRELVEKAPFISGDGSGFVKIGSGKKIRHTVQSRQNLGALDSGIQQTRSFSVYSVDELIKNAVLIESGPNLKKAEKPEVEAYHRFYIPIVCNGETYTIRIVAEEQKGTDKLMPVEGVLYDVMVDKKGPPSPLPSQENPARIVGGSWGSSAITIRQMLEGVKDIYDKPYFDSDGNPSDPTAWQLERYGQNDVAPINETDNVVGPRNELRETFSQAQIMNAQNVKKVYDGKNPLSMLLMEDSHNGSIIPSLDDDVKNELADDMAKFGAAVKNRKSFGPKKRIRIMKMPLVMNLIGADIKDIFMSASKIDTILKDHSGMDEETIIKTPALLTDPVAIFETTDAAKGNLKSYVVLVETYDSNNAPIIAAIHLNAFGTNSYDVHKLASVYGKSVASAGNQWFQKLSDDGKLRYINTKKAESWTTRSGLHVLPRGWTNSQLLDKSIKTERDFVNLKKDYPKNYQDRNAPRGAFSLFGNGEALIELFRSADRSTFLHEVGHFFLHDLRQLASLAETSEGTKAEWKAVSEWLGIGDIDFDNMTETDRANWRNAHEQFAAAFEKYLMEGKAPSSYLESVFNSFRKWLEAVYRSINSIVYMDDKNEPVSFEINDEIRGIMDRMLAAGEEIELSGALHDSARMRNALAKAGVHDDMLRVHDDATESMKNRSYTRLYSSMMDENASSGNIDGEYDILDDGDTLGRLAAESTVTQERMLVLGVELAALSKLTKKLDLVDIEGLETLEVEQAAQSAYEIVSGKRSGDIVNSVESWLANADRHAQESLSALSEGRIKEAIEAKRAQLLNVALANEALETAEEIRQQRGMIDRLLDDPEAAERAIGAEHYEQIRGLLERFGFKATGGNKGKSTGKPFADWAEENGFTEDGERGWFADFLLDEGERTTPSKMTVREFCDLVEAVRIIEEDGREKKNGKIGRELEELRQYIQSELANDSEVGRRLGLDGEYGGAAIELLLARARVLAEREGISPFAWGKRLLVDSNARYDSESDMAREPRGRLTGLSGGKYLLSLFKTANRSTFFHETAHFFLDDLRMMAKMEGVSETTLREWNETLQWLGVADIDFDNMTESDVKRWKDAQEKFAAAFNKYQMEGKAPTSTLQSLFDKFKEWLTSVFKSAENITYTDSEGNEVAFEMNDDIRGVFDSMLNAEAGIGAEHEGGLRNVDYGALSPEEGESYDQAIKTRMPKSNGRMVEGENPGELLWYPDDDYVPKLYNNEGLSWGEIKKKYNFEYIKFINGEPDFSGIAYDTVEIKEFSVIRDDNFNNADIESAQNNGCHSKDVKTWRLENGYTWHECQDMKTMQLIPTIINQNVVHLGGISKKKNELNN